MLLKTGTKTFILLFLCFFCLSPAMSFIRDVNAAEFSSFTDFLAQFEEASLEDKPAVLNDFISWQTDHGGFPIILNQTHVVFFYASAQNPSTITVAGDFNGWSPTADPLLKPETSISFFYLLKEFHPTARLDYKFVKDGDWILDPRNPNRVPGGYGDNSELAMPEFIQPAEIVYNASIPHGEVVILPSPWNSPKVQVYLPPNYNQSANYSSFYTSDGSEYINYASAIKVLDNLIYAQRIDPAIGIFVDPLGDRIAWYGCNPAYLDYLDGLVEYIDTTYATSPNPENRLHFGDSMGGLVSAYVGLERNETFKLIGCHSGAFWMGSDYGILPKYAQASEDLNLKMWFSAGIYEGSIYGDTQIMANYSLSKDWATQATYLYEGHSWGAWRHTLAELLEFFFVPTIPDNPNDSSDTGGEDGSDDGNNPRTISGAPLSSLGLAGLISIGGCRRRRKKEKMQVQYSRA